MSEPCPATITIGGELPRSKFKEFLEVLRASGAGPEWDGGLPDNVQDEDSLIELCDGPLHLMDSTANYGNFPDLEAWLKANKMPYNKHCDCDSNYEWNAQNSRYRPEHPKEEYVTMSDLDGGDLVYVRSVLKAREALYGGCIDAALKFLDDAVGALSSVTPLPDFAIVEDQ